MMEVGEEMAITHVRSDYDPVTNSYVNERKVTEWEGRVVRVYRRDYQAMSDVYTIASFATVIQDDGSPVETLVNANFECDVSQGYAAVDATPWALEMWELHQRKLENARREQDELRRVQVAEAERNRPVKGKRMEVFKGRKVPIGTLGTVAFVSDSGRALLKDDDRWEDRQAQGVWVDCRNLRAR